MFFRTTTLSPLLLLHICVFINIVNKISPNWFSYANAKKCTTGGRALMQLDFAYFMSMLEMTSGLKFTSHRTYVESYIKAYYMPKDLLEEWIKQQSQTNNYSTKQLIALIQCTCVNDKRTRQLLLAIVENGSNNISS